MGSKFLSGETSPLGTGNPSPLKKVTGTAGFIAKKQQDGINLW
jgi:hypothetical protein